MALLNKIEQMQLQNMFENPYHKNPEYVQEKKNMPCIYYKKVTLQIKYNRQFDMYMSYIFRGKQICFQITMYVCHVEGRTKTDGVR